MSKDHQRTYKVYKILKNLFEDLYKIFQRYYKDNIIFTEIHKPKIFKNLFKIFTKIFEKLGFSKIKEL